MFLDGQTPQSITLSGSLGLNTAAHPSDIDSNELSLAYNVWFEPLSGRLVTRGGLRCFDAPILPDGITMLHNYIRKPDEQWLMAVSGKNLYYLDVTTTPVWVLLSAIDSDTPQMRTFNGVLYVADNSASGLLKFDGSIATRLADSPIYCTALYEISNALVANSNTESELDAVYISASETDDFLPASGAVIVRAGYGDGMVVNGFSAISTTLVVSKIARTNGAIAKKVFYGIDVSDATRSAWTADYLSKNNAALNPHALVGTGQDVFYCDTQGIESLVTTDEYGDIATDPVIGGKVNNTFSAYTRLYQDTTKVVLLGNLASMLFISGNHIFMRSQLTGGFTEIVFDTDIKMAIEYGDAVLLAGEAGQVYYLSNQGNDEIEVGVFSEFKSLCVFKQINGSGDLLLSKTQVDNSYIIDGEYTISAFNGERPERTILDRVPFGVSSGDDLLYDANEDLYNANYDLGGTRTRTRRICRSKYRGDGITIQVATLKGGRMAIGSVAMEISPIGK